jgi:hypothetical protein
MLFQNGVVTIVAGDSSPQGWLDNTHLVLSAASGVEIFDVTGATQIVMTGLKSIPQHGGPSLAGVLPADLG